MQQKGLVKLRKAQVEVVAECLVPVEEAPLAWASGVDSPGASDNPEDIQASAVGNPAALDNLEDTQASAVGNLEALDTLVASGNLEGNPVAFVADSLGASHNQEAAVGSFPDAVVAADSALMGRQTKADS